MKQTFFCVHVEFYDRCKTKACVTSRVADRFPNNQYRHVPGMAALKLWFTDGNHAMQLLDSIKKGECELNDVLSFYSEQQDKRRVGA